MSFLDIMLMGALLTESVLLILLAHFYKKEKEKVQIEKTKMQFNKGKRADTLLILF